MAEIAVQRSSRSILNRSLAFLLRVLHFVVQVFVNLLKMLAQHLAWVRLRFLVYQPRADDIFIVTYPRSGTTWMQMIVYQLASGGDTNFRHIAEVAPWFERFAETGKDIEALPSPRLFKTHLRWGGWLRSIPKGPCKYIYVERNGEDVAVSYYHHARTTMGFKGSFDQFFRMFMRGRVGYGSWFRHVAEWRRQRHNPNVLYLTYEELKADLPRAMRAVAEFCGFPIPPGKFPQLVENCSFAYMKRHELKFEHHTGLVWENGLELEGFLRKGTTGEGQQYLDAAKHSAYHAEYGKWFGGPDFEHRSTTAREQPGVSA
jgi:LPS sulfotransferase NodH